MNSRLFLIVLNFIFLCLPFVAHAETTTFVAVDLAKEAAVPLLLHEEKGSEIARATPVAAKTVSDGVCTTAGSTLAADAYIGPVSKYLFRGNDLSANKWVVQGGVDITYKNITISYWTNYQAKASGDLKKVTENDVTLNYAYTPSEIVTFNIGNNMYNYLMATTNELYLKANLNIPATPTICVYWDWDQASRTGLFYTVSVAQKFAVGDLLALNLGALASYNQRNPSAAVLPGSSDSLDGGYSSLHNYEFSATADYTVNENLAISPYYLFSNAFNSRGRAAGIRPENVFGARMTFTF